MNNAVQSIQHSLTGQYKKCVQYDFKFTSVVFTLIYLLVRTVQSTVYIQSHVRHCRLKVQYKIDR